MSKRKNEGPTIETRNICGYRDRARCFRCGRSLYGVPASLHHRLMRSQGAGYADLHKPSNLIWLCGTGTTGCHWYVHNHPAESYEAGWLVHPEDDPHEVPVLHDKRDYVLLDDDGHMRRVTC